LTKGALERTPRADEFESFPTIDGVLEALNEAGLCPTEINHPFYGRNAEYEMVCPWAAEHPEGRSQAVYVARDLANPFGRFRCACEHARPRDVMDLMDHLGILDGLRGGGLIAAPQKLREEAAKGLISNRSKPEGGGEIGLIMDDAFEVLSTPTEILDPDGKSQEAREEGTPLDQYSLRGRLEQLKREMVAAIFVLGRLALLGQITFIFAAPGTGKTLIVFYLLLESLRRGIISGKRVYYVNMDDNLQGLHDKTEIAEEYGFHVIAEGHRSFKASVLMATLEKMTKDGSARNSIIIVDTTKKIVNVMDKKESSLIMSTFRRFSMKGGTIIGLAHTNKKRGDDGKSVYAGTSDLRDDADCTYVVDEVDGGYETNEKFVNFENTKRRGNNTLDVTYAYALDGDISYADRLLSVREVESERLSPIKQANGQGSEASVIEVIRTCIAERFSTKMKLATEVGKRAGISRAEAGKIIDRHTGDDPLKHHWCFTVGARGSHVYCLLGPPDAEPPETGAG